MDLKALLGELEVELEGSKDPLIREGSLREQIELLKEEVDSLERLIRLLQEQISMLKSFLKL